MDGINARSAEELIRRGFIDVNTTPINMVEALETTSIRGYIKKGLNKMVENAVNKGTTNIRNEMNMMKKELIKEVGVHSDIIQKQASKKMKVELALLKKQFKAAMDCI